MFRSPSSFTKKEQRENLKRCFNLTDAKSKNKTAKTLH